MTGSPLHPHLAAVRHRAEDLVRAGRFEEAIPLYQHLLAAAPVLPDSWYNLGYLLQSTGRAEEALLAYDKAIALGIGAVEEVRRNKALILADHLARPEAAEAELRAALRSNGRFVPAWVELGRLAEQVGNRDDARSAYESALSIDPRHASALAHLANVRKPSGPADALIQRLTHAAADPSSAPADRATLGFALGKVLDEVGEYDKAFSAYRGANEMSRLSAGAGWGGYDRARWEAWVRQLPDRLRPATGSEGRHTSPIEPRLIFVCGMFRSGSTLLETILSAHPRVTAGGELDVIPRVANSLWRRLAAGRPSQEELVAARVQYLHALRSRFPDARVFTDKRPDNFLHIGLIKTLFPDAKIIHTHRNALDNCLSVFFTHFDLSQAYSLDLADIAHWYRLYEELMGRWKTMYAHDIVDVEYEALVSEPRSQIERVLRFLELDWDEACLNFHSTERSVQTPSVWQVRQPLYTRSCGRWKNYRDHLDPLARGLGLAL